MTTVEDFAATKIRLKWLNVLLFSAAYSPPRGHLMPQNSIGGPFGVMSRLPRSLVYIVEDVFKILFSEIEVSHFHLHMFSY